MARHHGVLFSKLFLISAIVIMIGYFVFVSAASAENGATKFENTKGEHKGYVVIFKEGALIDYNEEVFEEESVFSTIFNSNEEKLEQRKGEIKKELDTRKKEISGIIEGGRKNPISPLTISK